MACHGRLLSCSFGARYQLRDLKFEQVTALPGDSVASQFMITRLYPPKLLERALVAVDITFSNEKQTDVLDEE